MGPGHCVLCASSSTESHHMWDFYPIAMRSTIWGSAQTERNCNANWGAEYKAGSHAATVGECKERCVSESTCNGITYGRPGGVWPGHCVLCASSSTESHHMWDFYPLTMLS